MLWSPSSSRLFILSFTLRLLLLIRSIYALPFPHPQDVTANLPLVEVTVQTITTAMVETTTVELDLPAFTPLFAPVSLDTAASVPIATVQAVTQIATQYVTAPQSTITRVVYQTQTTVPSQSQSPPGASTSPPSTPIRTSTAASPSGSTWILPRTFTDLDSFDVQKYSGGQTNMQIVLGIPSTASAASGVVAPLSSTSGSAQPQQTLPPSPEPWNNMTDNALRVYFPAGSINPGNTQAPVGGSQFYASPIPLDRATNVSMEYSVFMSANMSYVKGGKLPGLYGGHYGCSGGNVADTCFSTRLMWRPNGAGELYLYAEKAKQLPSLCEAPDSDCNAVYGLSLGRGSFYYAPGAWTYLRQTVRLNTPGVADGGFTLDVNGLRVMDLNGIFYRDAASADPSSISAAPTSSSTNEPTNIMSNSKSSVAASTISPTLPPASPPSSTSTPNASLLGGGAGLLGGLLGGLTGLITPPVGGSATSESLVRGVRLRSPKAILSAHRRRKTLQLTRLANGPLELLAPSRLVVRDPNLIELAKRRRRAMKELNQRVLVDSPPLLSDEGTTASMPGKVSDPILDASLSTPAPAFGFTGIFFSTFFGGHDPSWATPTDQYIWFKDFALQVNA